MLLTSYKISFTDEAYCTITAAIKVVNDIIESLDCQKYCAALILSLLIRQKLLTQLIMLFSLIDSIKLVYLGML